MRIIKSLIFFFILDFFATGCKIEYRPPVESPKTGYLVVEGFINSDGGPTTITLSRTLKIYNDSTRDNREHNAIVNIEGINNETFPLYETGDGVYTSSPLQLDPNEKYRLKIKTQYGKEYESDYSSYRTTPDIDSLTWKRDNNGVKIYISTHDEKVKPGYYNWNYKETWEIHSTYYSTVKFLYNPGNPLPFGVGYRNQDQTPDIALYRCWQDVISSNINIGSSEKLNRNLIYFPIMLIEPQSRKLSVMYSIKVLQYAVSKEDYDYLKILKTNSEEIGSITGPLPSELTGNIHCITTPSETVIGFVEVSQEKQSERLFISNDDVPGWGYKMQCAQQIVSNDFVSLRDNSDLYPTTVLTSDPFLGITSFYATPEINCVDCRLYGSPVKPAFWP
jgi:hypothetical protein